ncbi:hypothetical protein ACFVQ3_09245 [Oerskovia sp. NPDC057915]|uniref:hypothetical protein n=1 Tax=Oerskovia sp. NPDC057915 TaxID=3346280 RepID=UPI0036D79BA0
MFAVTTAAATALLLVVGLFLGALPATADPTGSSSAPDPQGVGIEVDVSGITSRSQVEAEPGAAVAGGVLIVRGYGLVPFATYDVDLRSADAPPVRLGTVVALADGTFELSTRLPDPVRPGTYFVRVTDPATGTYLDTVAFEVGAAVEPGGGTPGTTGGATPGAGAGNGPGGRELAATGPLPQRPGAGSGVEAEAEDGLAFTGTALAGTAAAAGALVVLGATVTAGVARRRRRSGTT